MSLDGVVQAPVGAGENTSGGFAHGGWHEPYIESTTLKEPLGWDGATLLRGDVAEAVAALKAEDGGPLHLVGSPTLAHTLLASDLVDEFRLVVDPVVVGSGMRLFEAPEPRPLRRSRPGPRAPGRCW